MGEENRSWKIFVETIEMRIKLFKRTKKQKIQMNSKTVTKALLHQRKTNKESKLDKVMSPTRRLIYFSNQLTLVTEFHLAA